MMTLFSDRLIYVPLTTEYAEDFFKMESDPEVMKYYRRPLVKDREESLKNVLVYLKYAMDHQGLGAWAVISKESADFVGIGVIIHLDKNPDAKEFEIGYRLPQLHWGKGYATEIARTFVDYGFNQMKLSELYGTINPENAVSQKVLEKVGFKYIGEAAYHGGSKVFKLLP
jgi:ribosomal-protein-alanine N-acetyltransferase